MLVVSTAPVANFPPVSMTLAGTGVDNTSDKFAADVNDTSGNWPPISTGYRILDTGYRIQYTVYRILVQRDTGERRVKEKR